MEAPNELMQAIQKNDVKFISCYLRGGININKICSNGMTLIGVAAQSGNLPALKALLEHSYSSSAGFRNDNCSKPQYLQLEPDGPKRSKNIGYFVVCRDIEENEFGDGPTPDGMEALEWDMEVNETHFSTDEEEEGEFNIYKWYANILNRTSLMLESPERDFGRLDSHGKSVLHYAVISGNIDMVEYIMATLGKELTVNQNDASCFSPLHMAAANGDVEMVEWLLRKGANVNAIGGKQRESPLHVAARTAHFDVMKLLIDAGADINSVDVEERSILTTTVRCGKEETVRYLLKLGARVNHEESRGLTALCFAVWARNTSLARLLLEGGSRLRPAHFLLHTAVSICNLEMVRLLVEAGALLNTKDRDGNTPLMLACLRIHIPIARYLLEQGADVNAASHIDGKTALHICAYDVRDEASINEMMELLVRHGADLNITTFHSHALAYSIILENRCATAALIQHGVDIFMKGDPSHADNLSLAYRYGNLDIVKMFVYAGFPVSEMLWQPTILPFTVVDPSRDFLLMVKSNPLKLQEWCRIAIRRRLGPSELMSRICALPLPPLLQRYVALQIL